MSLGNWGESLLQDAVGAFFGSDYLRDYTHASKTFRPNSYEYTPKLKFLFHTYFNINPEAYAATSQTNFGLLVKEVKLPSFNFQTTQLNQYNRKRIVQTKIKYDPIEIIFHDDNGNNMNKLWYAYYSYYYNEGAAFDNPFNPVGGTSTTVRGRSYNRRNIYDDAGAVSEDNQWGFSGGGNSSSSMKVKVPFFKNITVYGLNQHNFTAYTFINPIITSFSHDSYNYNEGAGIMQNRMVIDYETVTYADGALDGENPGNFIPGFGDDTHYDRSTSPIAKLGANATILGQGGLVAAAGGTIRSLANGDLFGAILTSGTAYNTFKNVNLKNVATSELNTMLRNSINNTPNTRNKLFSFPTAGATPGPNGLAGSPVINGRSAPALISNAQTAGEQNIGSSYSNGIVTPAGLQKDIPYNPSFPSYTIY